MVIERKIKLDQEEYFIGFKLKYNKNGKLVRMDNGYFDLGDLSIMIDFFEKKYNKDEKYDEFNAYMNDIIYLHDRFPFLTYIKDVSYGKNNEIIQIGYIENKEIKAYIKSRNLEVDKWDKTDCLCPMLYN